MNLIDTHTHLYLNQFNGDRDSIIQNAINQGITRMILPAIDSSTFESMINLTQKYPENCLPMIGLHPTSVKDNYEDELELVEEELKTGKYIGVGEIGIDLYWDKTYSEEQRDALVNQLRWAKKYKLPVAIHTRDSFNEVYNIVKNELTEELTGVFHCFTGSLNEAYRIMDIGFSMGIGGIVTFKNAGLAEVVSALPIESIVLETDSPFLTPSPHRGKRNESSYLNFIAMKIAEISNMTMQEIIEKTTHNAVKLFKLN